MSARRIQDEFSHIEPKWRRLYHRHKALGLCVRCSEPQAPGDPQHCLNHSIKIDPMTPGWAKRRVKHA
jgi:hypothetical protein